MARIKALEAECSKNDCVVRAVVCSTAKVDEPVKPTVANWCRRHGVEELLAERTDFLGRADLGCQAVKCKAKAVLVVCRDRQEFFSRTCKLHALRMLMDADAFDKEAALVAAEKDAKPKRGKK